eukprot:COSAG01_NODE_544_length_15682_cov_107.959379_10_plen_85_part_00
MLPCVITAGGAGAARAWEAEPLGRGFCCWACWGIDWEALAARWAAPRERQAAVVPAHARTGQLEALSSHREPAAAVAVAEPPHP